VAASYTRYADDLTLSGGPAVARRSESLVAGVDRVVRAAGFRLNPAKTRIRRPHQRQSVTGIVVTTTRTSPGFRAHLRGAEISWAGTLSPARRARLLAMFGNVDWDG
jgi:RNA-directed DNA polymerase